MKRKLLICILASTTFLACNKELGVDALTADFVATNARIVDGNTLTYKLGDTCRFDINGYADNITYWDGTLGHQYSYRTRNSGIGDIFMSFTSQAQYGSETNTLKVLAATNLANLDSTTVVNAQWTNIAPDRAELSLTGNTAVSTGDINISDLIQSPDDLLYIAFKYNSNITTGNRRTWTITNYLVRNEGEDFSSTLGNLVDDATAWTRYGNVWAPASRRWVANASTLTIAGGTASDPINESWIISKPMAVGKLTPDGPSATVKYLTAAETTSYEYIYSEVGEYKATFSFYNNTVDDTKSGIKEFNIKIIP